MRKRIFLVSTTKNVAQELARDVGLERPKVAFVITGAEPEEDTSWLEADRLALEKTTDWQLQKYTISNKSQEEIRRELGVYDVVYMAGGNTLFLLQQIQKSGFAGVIRELVDQGKVYVGQSAGAIVAGPNIYPMRRVDKVHAAPDINGYEGLGLVDVVAVPHWGDPERREMYFGDRLQKIFNEEYKYILLNDYQYAGVVDGGYRIVDVRTDTA